MKPAGCRVYDGGLVDAFELAFDFREFLKETPEGFTRGLFDCEQVPRILRLDVVSLEIIADEIAQLLPRVYGPGRDGEEPCEGDAFEDERDTFRLGRVIPPAASTAVSYTRRNSEGSVQPSKGVTSGILKPDGQRAASSPGLNGELGSPRSSGAAGWLSTAAGVD